MTDVRNSRTPVRLLYVGMTYDYGQPERGFSYEYVNFLETLRRMEGLEVDFFPVDEMLREKGFEEMNRALLVRVAESSPDICFFVLFTDEIAPATIEAITLTSGATTVGWFGDDHWRFLPFSRHFAPGFHWVVTTDSEAVERYRALGCDGVIKSQWGFNHHLAARAEAWEEFDVTFIGQVHSRRRETIDYLRRAGIDVRCWGRGWEQGRLQQDAMSSMYGRSRINLNFTESSVVAGWKPIVKCVLNRRADDTLHVRAPGRMLDHARIILSARRAQIKGRNFEIPGNGGFLLTSHADNIEDYFVPGEEIALFSSREDLAERIRYFLAHPGERERIRVAGRTRALRDHTYERRFLDIFAAIGAKGETASGRTA
jgi:spore maturation protein CgeB